MPFELFASLDSPKWHSRQNCVVEGAVLPVGSGVMFGLYGALTKNIVAYHLPPPSAAIWFAVLEVNTVMTCWLWQVVQTT